MGPLLPVLHPTTLQMKMALALRVEGLKPRVLIAKANKLLLLAIQDSTEPFLLTTLERILLNHVKAATDKLNRLVVQLRGRFHEMARLLALLLQDAREHSRFTRDAAKGCIVECLGSARGFLRRHLFTQQFPRVILFKLFIRTICLFKQFYYKNGHYSSSLLRLHSLLSEAAMHTEISASTTCALVGLQENWNTQG